MRQVYSPANPVEAHMLAHMLEHEGITVHIHGEALQGAAGDLPVSNLVQLLVADEDYNRARELLLAWEQRTRAEDAEDVRKARRFPIVAALGFALIGATFGIVGKSLWDRGRIPIDTAQVGLDQNGDGRDDLTYFYRGVGQAAYRAESDYNFDGRVDSIVHYDGAGIPQREERDENFDGIFEINLDYRAGTVARSDIDTNGDGATDMHVFYRFGVVDREEINDPATNRVARVNYYEHALLARGETDLDHDGTLETVTRYNRFGQPMADE